MALSAEQRQETLDLMSEAFALGMAKFRSAAEEEEAKKLAENPPTPKTGENDGGSFGFVDYILGR
jgi:hypothetical protein